MGNKNNKGKKDPKGKANPKSPPPPAQDKGKTSSYQIKLLLIGDSGVGKSSLLLRFCDNTFTDGYIANIGAEYKERTIDVDGTELQYQVFDTAGQERFRTITSSYYRGAGAIIVVYDLSNQESFDNVRKWMQEIDRYAEESTHRFLIGTKSDLSADREVETETARDFAEQLSIEFMECSAKDGTNVDEAFKTIGIAIKEADD